ncbi:NUDIX domain-containing protein [Candidatus Bathyarchaeota archaeon]|nr:MAG: NUDIX domain-containing protein [Candidatus Bathyarchaeota archaeon]
MPAKGKKLNFSSRDKWRAWLARNHQTVREIWLLYDKKLSETRLISYRDFLDQAVEEAICYGWIDSRVKRIGLTKLGVRFTPRRSTSNWSKYKRVRALMLIQSGKMTKAGIDVLPCEWVSKNLNGKNVQRIIAADVVAGILMERRRFLVEKRRADDEADPGFVEIPGGHVDPGESLEEALRREMREELGIDVERTKLVQKSLYTASNGERQRIHYFHVEKWKGRIRSTEAERVYWESEISNLSVIPDRRAVRKVLSSKP